MLVFYLYIQYSGVYVSELESVYGCYLYIWCMRGEVGEFHIIEKLSQILNVWTYIKKLLVSPLRVHNNCELPVEIYNICKCLVWIGNRCSIRSGVDICD